MALSGRGDGIVIGRSEGLALASFRMFEAGAFSADPNDPYRVDASRLASLTRDELAAGFQASDANPLSGLDGRAALIARLGATVAANPAVFGREPRPGGLFDHLAATAVPAPRILAALLAHLGAIWPGRIALGGVALGDTWRHPAIVRDDATTGLIPFHKLSQWLAYSLIEPLQAAGIAVTEIDGLTGLAEYRNGGLFVDADVISLRDRRRCSAGEFRRLDACGRMARAHRRAARPHRAAGARAARRQRRSVPACARARRGHLGGRPPPGAATARWRSAHSRRQRRHGVLRGK